MKSKSYCLFLRVITAGTFLLASGTSLSGQEFKNDPNLHRGVQPKIIKPDNGAILKNFPRETKFEWEALSGVKSYELRVDYFDGQWKTLKTLKVAGTTATVNFIGDNTGHWAVRAIYEDGKPGIWSDVWVFRYKTSKEGSSGTSTGTKTNAGGSKTEQELPAPELTYPAAGATLDFFPRRFIFRWNKIEGARQYQIQVQYNDGAWKNQYVQMVIPNAFEITFVGAQPGRWRVRAFVEGKGGKWSEWREFKFIK